MGNNEAFSSFESSVLACYNHRVLTKSLLIELMRTYEGMDVDSGGMAGTLSKGDKLDITDITLKMFEVKTPPRPKLPRDYRKWTPAQSKANDDWNEARDTAFRKITKDFGRWD